MAAALSRHAFQRGILSQSICCLPGVAEKRAALLANLRIATVGDLLSHFPRDYDDRRHITPIAELEEGSSGTISVEVVSSRAVRLRRGLSMAEVKVRDDSGALKAVWFGRDYLARVLRPQQQVILSGTVGKFGGMALRNADYEVLSGDEEDLLNTGRIVPVYRLTDGVSQRMLRRLMATALEETEDRLEETLPASLLTGRGYPGIRPAFRAAHFPEELEEARAARNRFAYEELLGIQLGILRSRAVRLDEERGHQHETGGPILGAVRASLPFSLTAAQDRAVSDILADLASPRPMLRLLQGDVGCGKTVVALHAIAAAADGGYQTAVMAPTEILAEQHWLTLRDQLEPIGLTVSVLTGSTPDAERVRSEAAKGKTNVVVGTHALIQASSAFENLGLVIIDEQHRFGVLQRQALAQKGISPDVLHMTATPIPRTLAITVYGGMDVSVIDELPPGRVPVKTKRITAGKTEWLYEFVRKQAEKGQQTYYVCPLVEESSKRELTSVKRHCKELSEGPLSGLRTGLLHGRLSPRDKEAVMQRFKAGEIDVLFSTTVIEVGIDCPAATTMVIEDAGQFGLPQLHQLRGRVGRGAEQAHCFLVGTPKTKEGMQRLRVLCETTSGFDIAEEDLALRGPGEFHGVRQAGLDDLRLADLVRDVRLLDAARRDAQGILERDSGLSEPNMGALAEAARQFQAFHA